MNQPPWLLGCLEYRLLKVSSIAVSISMRAERVQGVKAKIPACPERGASGALVLTKGKRTYSRLAL